MTTRTHLKPAAPVKPQVKRYRPAPAKPYTAPEAPPWSHRLLPRAIRGAMSSLGWWNDPVPQLPSGHISQVRAVLKRYGWCQVLDTSPTGRMCIRGAQVLLERTGHATPATREKAVEFIEEILREYGVSLSFYTWNDLPGNSLKTVDRVLGLAESRAKTKGL